MSRRGVSLLFGPKEIYVIQFLPFMRPLDERDAYLKDRPVAILTVACVVATPFVLFALALFFRYW